jgi:hypothetical protein
LATFFVVFLAAFFFFIAMTISPSEREKQNLSAIV